ncbi:MAG: hypothetical protein D8M58_07895 [Calditrichaeota bacterium]|nr:MAG: hypothetical protein DWQ03_18595 [Calditrichota bacterium]MBL1205303.1 hypothetical protein [Calditrichota bacterium]NOG45132.1 hypothetical protein [Calditrichota bacterium]
MLMIAASVVLLLLLAWAGLIYLRKSLWDVVHRNMLDLEDNYSGKIIRNSFVARPVFHGNVNGNDLTINFSTARTSSGRKTYIDISLNAVQDFSLTITEKSWQLEQNNESPDNAGEVLSNNGKAFFIMPADNKKIKALIEKEELKDVLGTFENLAYFFVGQSGVICEFWSDKIDRDTGFEIMQPRLEQIQKLLEILK